MGSWSEQQEANKERKEKDGNVSSNIHRRHYSSRRIFDLAQNQIWEEMARKLITH